MGHLDPHQLRRHYEAADLFLHSASSEGFGNSVIEAQAMAVPVVCTDAEGLRENVADGVTGLVVARGDVTALAAALLELATDAPRRAELGRAGALRARAEFGLDRQLDRWTDFYTAVTGSPPPDR